METARTFSSALAGAIHALCIALELSRLSWVVAVQGRDRARPALHKLAAGNAQGLLAIMERAHAAQRRAGASFVATMRSATTASSLAGTSNDSIPPGGVNPPAMKSSFTKRPLEAC